MNYLLACVVQQVLILFAERGVCWVQIIFFTPLPCLDLIFRLPRAHCTISAKERRERATDLLDQVGLLDRMHHYPSMLSGMRGVSVAECLQRLRVEGRHGSLTQCVVDCRTCGVHLTALSCWGVTGLYHTHLPSHCLFVLFFFDKYGWFILSFLYHRLSLSVGSGCTQQRNHPKQFKKILFRRRTAACHDRARRGQQPGLASLGRADRRP